MIDFSDYVLINEDTLKRLNETIDKVIEEKSWVPIDYELLENVLRVILRNAKSRNESDFPTVVRIKKEEMLGIALDFFRAIDEKLYEEAVDIIIKQHNNIKVNIYNAHEVKNLRRINEFGMQDYTPNGSVQTKNGKATLRVPTGWFLTSKESKILGKDTCTLEDLYTLVHEISHFFDLDFAQDGEEITKGKENGRSATRELLGEGTAIAFEGMLTEYLLKNTTYPKSKIRDIMIITTNSLFRDARISYAELILAREKEKNGRITREYIEDFVRKNSFSPRFTKNMIRVIINDSMGMMHRKRYAIARLISPTIIKKTRQGRKWSIKKILRRSKK